MLAPEGKNAMVGSIVFCPEGKTASKKGSTTSSFLIISLFKSLTTKLLPLQLFWIDF